MENETSNETKTANDAKPVLCAGYSTEHFLEIKNKFNNIKTPFDKFRFISRCSGIELIIKGKRYWFEFFSKQITPTDIYIPDSSFVRMLHIACT